jgi:hypothetical protein
LRAGIGKQFGTKPDESFLKSRRDRTGRLAFSKASASPLNAGRRDDEGRNIEIRHPVALGRTDQGTEREAGDGGWNEMHIIAHGQHAVIAPMKPATEPTDGE